MLQFQISRTTVNWKLYGVLQDPVFLQWTRFLWENKHFDFYYSRAEKIITLTGFVHYMENKLIYRVLSQCIASRVLFLNLVRFVCTYIKCTLAAVTAFQNEVKIFSSPDLAFIAAEVYLCNKHLFCLLYVKLFLYDHAFKNQHCIIYHFIWFILVL